MRLNKIIPKTDVEKLAKEVLGRGPKAALPKNLPDRWLRAIGRDLMRAHKARLEGRDDDPSLDLSGPLLLVAALRTQQPQINVDESGFSVEELKDDLENFAIAVRDEIVGRETGVYLRRHDFPLRFSDHAS